MGLRVQIDFPISALDKKLTQLRRFDKSPGSNRATIKRVVRKIAEEIFHLTRIRTPRETGHARSSWVIESTPEWVIFNRVDYINVLEFGGYKGNAGKTQPGVSPFTKTWVSRKAPRGMLRLTLQEFDGAKTVRLLRRELGKII